MSALSKILVPFDDNQRSIQALQYAAMFASKINAKIVALHLSDPKEYRSMEEFQKEVDQMVKDQLIPKLMVIQNSFPDIVKIDLQIRGLEKPLHRHILEFSAENDIDFIILRSHGLPDPNNWDLTFKSTTAYKVVLESYCPVFTFSQDVSTNTIQNMVVPLDLIEGSLYKLPLAISIAEQFGATVHLVSTAERKEDHHDLTQQIEEIGRELEKRSIQVRKTVFTNIDLPAAIKAYTATSRIDLIIIMNRPGFRWSDMWVSPVAKRIICHSKVPVISVRANKPMEIGI